MKVCAKRCDRCLFGPRPIVDKERQREILRKLAAEDDYFICHEHGTGDGDEFYGEKVMCRGDYDRGPMRTNIARIAHRLGVVRFVDPPST